MVIKDFLKQVIQKYINALIRFVNADMIKELLRWKGLIMTEVESFIAECHENIEKIKTFIDLKNELNIDISEYDCGILMGKKDVLKKIVNYLHQQG